MSDQKISEQDISSLFNNLNMEEDSIEDLDLKFTDDSVDDASFIEDKIKLYDFKSPDKFSKDQLRTIQMIYENYGRSITTSLSTYLRKYVSIRVSSVDQASYSQFTKTVSNPSLLAIVDMYPLKGSAIMDIPPSLTFSLIDRVLGGEGGMINEFRELTDIEISVMDGLLHRLLFSLRDVWHSVVRLKPRLERIESNVQFVQIIPPNDTVLVVTLNAEIGDVEGNILFCIPYITLESITTKLYARSIYQNYTTDNDENVGAVKEHMDSISVELAAILGNIKSSFRDVLSLKVGDYIMTDRKSNQYLDLKVGGDIKYKVVPGKVGRQLGVKITQRKKVDMSKKLKGMQYE